MSERALDLVDRFALTSSRRDRIAAHATPNGLSSKTSATLARKMAARR